MTVNELSQYRSLVIESERLKNKLEELEIKKNSYIKTDCVQASDTEYPYTSYSIPISGVTWPDTAEAVEIAEIRKLYKENSRRISQELIKLEEYIYRVKDGEMRLILTLRYIDGLKWRQIPSKLNRTGDGSTERKKHDRFLNISPNSPR